VNFGARKTKGAHKNIFMFRSRLVKVMSQTVYFCPDVCVCAREPLAIFIVESEGMRSELSLLLSPIWNSSTMNNCLRKPLTSNL
jgi:hypothetical protein